MDVKQPSGRTSRKTSSRGRRATTRARVSVGRCKQPQTACGDICDTPQTTSTLTQTCRSLVRRKSKSKNRTRSRSRQRAPSRDRTSLNSDASYCCCGNCNCTSPNRRSINRRDDDYNRNLRSRSHSPRPRSRAEHLQPVLNAKGDIKIHTSRNEDEDNNSTVVTQKTTDGSVIIKSVGDTCGRGDSTQRCRDQGTDPDDELSSRVGPQRSMDLLGGVEIRFDHSTFPLSPLPVITAESTETFSSDPPMVSRPLYACEQPCRTTRPHSRSCSRSRSRSKKRNRPPDSHDEKDEQQCAPPSGHARQCLENCRSPWSPSLICSCLCHDPDRDVAWSSWPIFGPRIAAWVQDHRRDVMDRMRTEQTRRNCR